MRAAVYAVSLIVLAFGLWAVAARLMTPPSRVVATYSEDNGYFYRMTAKFTVIATGEAVDFNYVVACNIRLTRWRDGGRSDDSTYSPQVMVKATAKGQAIAIRSLRLCNGVTSENDDVPPDVLPLAIWFDSVDDLAYGIGYVSEDAYDNPLSKLRFRGARIDRATRADWEAWRKKSAEEYVQRGTLPGPWGYNGSDFEPADGKYVATCRGYNRLKLPEGARERARTLWPSDRPRFWTVPNEDDSRLRNLLFDSAIKDERAEPWSDHYGSPGSGGWAPSSGMPLKSGRIVQLRPHVPTSWPTENYPVLWPPMTSANPLTVAPLLGPSDMYVHKVDFRDGALNGFAGCFSRGDLFGRKIAAVDPAWITKPHVFMIEDQVVRQRPDGRSIDFLWPAFIMERDECVFIQFEALLL